VIQAGAIGRDGDVLILDMGVPVRIEAIAQRLARATDPHAQVVYTGLRAGEKLHEELFSTDEVPQATSHQLITSCAVPPIPVDLVRSMSTTAASEVAKTQLAALATTSSELPDVALIRAAAGIGGGAASNIRHLHSVAGSNLG
jgi:FlaA1/EpsC-like NDP-sugar epimerase